MNLPQPLLGDITAFTIACPDPDVSLEYYRQLGFDETMRSDFPFPWIHVSDGAVLIMLRKGDAPYFALTYYGGNMAAVAASLEQQGIVFAQKPAAKDMLQRYVIESPDGLVISLINIEGFAKPAGPTMLTIGQQDMFTIEKYPNKICGLYGELAVPVADLDAATGFWKKLGFTAVSTFTAPYPWAIVTDGLAVVGLHQANHFDYPAITYFAPDMKDRIAALKDKGLAGMAEKNESNAVLTTPEGQHINLFKLGM